MCQNSFLKPNQGTGQSKVFLLPRARSKIIYSASAFADISNIQRRKQILITALFGLSLSEAICASGWPRRKTSIYTGKTGTWSQNDAPCK